MEAPIIFLHYNDSPYLKYTLRVAKFFNPHKKVIFLGDASNSKYKKYGIEHFLFDNYADTPMIDSFLKVYQRVGGTKFQRINSNKGGEDWTKFNFMKWFVLLNFIQKNNISKFWTFDTDTMIVSDLSRLEERYEAFDYTVMNNNHQLQGLVNNQLYLEKFCSLVIGLFLDEAYLTHLKNTEFKENPSFGFTIMRVFKELASRCQPNVKPLEDIINQEYFDTCICAVKDEIPYDEKIRGRTLKKLFYTEDGLLYVLNSSINQYVRVLTTNLSWVPTYVYDKVYKIVMNQNSAFNASKEGELKELSLSETIKSAWKRKIYSSLNKLPLINSR